MSRIIMPKKPKEIQLHIAITLVGDRLSPIAAEREDLEVNQWAARFMQGKFGNITVKEFEQVFVEFYETALKELRNLGALRPGE